MLREGEGIDGDILNKKKSTIPVCPSSTKLYNGEVLEGGLNTCLLLAWCDLYGIQMHEWVAMKRGGANDKSCEIWFCPFEMQRFFRQMIGARGSAYSGHRRFHSHPLVRQIVDHSPCSEQYTTRGYSEVAWFFFCSMWYHLWNETDSVKKSRQESHALRHLTNRKYIYSELNFDSILLQDNNALLKYFRGVVTWKARLHLDDETTQNVTTIIKD